MGELGVHSVHTLHRLSGTQGRGYVIPRVSCICWAGEQGLLVQQILQEGPHVLMHLLRMALWNPMPTAWQDVAFQPTRHKATTNGSHKPLL